MKPIGFSLCILALAAFAASFAKAATTMLPDLSPSAAVVPETNCAVRIQWPATGEVLRFGFDLRFEGAVSNAIEVSFGTDADGDGRLGFRERELTVGWRGGRYFVCNELTRERLFSPPAAGRSSRAIRAALSIGMRPLRGFGSSRCPAATSPSLRHRTAFTRNGASSSSCVEKKKGNRHS